MARYVKIAAVSILPIYAYEKDLPAGITMTDRVIALLKDQIQPVLRDRPDLIVLPEYCDLLYGGSCADSARLCLENGNRVLEYLQALARENRCYITYPSRIVLPDGTARNTVRMIDREGTVIGTYHKNFVMVTETENYNILCGREIPVFACDFGRVCPILCFDLNFEENRARIKALKPDITVFCSRFHGSFLQNFFAYDTRSYFVSALSNLVMILYLALCKKPADRSTAIGMAVAYLISWGIQFFTLAIPLLAKKSFPWPTRRLRNPDTALSLRRSLPVMFGSWLIPMITLITGAFSSFIDSETVEVGTASGAAIVVYENAFSVFTIAAGLLTYGICNYIFPKLSETFAKKEETAFEALIAKGLFASLTLMLPITVLLFLLSRETVSLLYLRGHFTEGLAAAASASLRILSLAIPAYGLTELFSRVCYACGKVRYPMAASLGGIACTLIFDSVCLLTSHLSVRTAAFGSALGMIASALILGVMTFSRFPGILRGIPPRKMFALIAATVTSGGCMALTLLFLHGFSYFSQTFQNFITIAIVFAVGFVVYLIWLIMTKIISSDLFR